MSDVIISYACCDYSTTLRFPVKWTKCICAFVKLDNNSLGHRSGAKPWEKSLFHSLGDSAHLLPSVTMSVLSWGEGAGIWLKGNTSQFLSCPLSSESMPCSDRGSEKLKCRKANWLRHHEELKEQDSSVNWWHWGDIHFHPAKVSSASPQSNAIQVVSDNSENFREFSQPHQSLCQGWTWGQNRFPFIFKTKQQHKISNDPILPHQSIYMKFLC